MEKKIRLIHLRLGKYTQYATNQKMLGIYYGAQSDVYRIPKGMSVSDACKVISFLSEKVENENNIEPASVKSVRTVISLLEDWGFEKTNDVDEHSGFEHTIERYPFNRKINIKIEIKKGVLNLFTIDGMDEFKKSDRYKYYFDWFTPGVSKEEIAGIYDNLISEEYKKVDEIKNIVKKLDEESEKEK